MKKILFLLLITTFSFSQEKALTVAQIDSIYVKAIKNLTLLKSSKEITYFELDSINSKYKNELESEVFKFYDNDKLSSISLKDRKSIPLLRLEFYIDDDRNVNFYFYYIFFKATKIKKSRHIEISIENPGRPSHMQPDIIFTFDKMTNSWKITKNEYHFEF